MTIKPQIRRIIEIPADQDPSYFGLRFADLVIHDGQVIKDRDGDVPRPATAEELAEARRV